MTGAPSASPRVKPRYLPLRRAAFLLQAIVIVGLPFLTVGGESAFRFDVPTLRLHFFGYTLWMQDFFLFLLVTLWLTFLIVLATTVLGRLWCGWLCPQSAVIEIVEWIGERSGLPRSARRYLKHPLTLLFSALVSATILWYFVPPALFFETMGRPAAQSSQSRLVWGFFLGQWFLVYVEVAFLGRRFCATICPYAKLQGALFDRDTLVVEYDRARSADCRGCDRCVQVCPTGMDIKDGLRAECIACARCVDACNAMTRPRGIATLVRYRWGGWGRLVRPPVVFMSLAVSLLAALALWWGLGIRPLEFTVSRNVGALYAVAPSGAVLNAYRVHVQNKGPQPSTVDLSVEPGTDFRALGDVRLHFAPGEDRVFTLNIALKRPLTTGPHPIRFIFVNTAEQQVYRRTGTFYVP